MGSDLYAQVEPHLGFEEEKQKLYEIFLEKLLSLRVKSFLDIGCGSGAFLRLAQEAGLEAEGIDISAQMVQRAKKDGLNCKKRDICDVQAQFEAAVAIFDVINYMNVEEVKRFFQCVKSVLKERGYFICDINTLFGFEEIAQGAMNIETDDGFIAIDANFYEKKLITDIVYFQKRDDECYRKSKQQIIQYYHDVTFLKKLGLILVDIDFVRLFGDEYDKAILTFQKG